MTLLTFENVSKFYGASLLFKMFPLKFQQERLWVSLAQTVPEKQP